MVKGVFTEKVLKNHTELLTKAKASIQNDIEEGNYDIHKIVRKKKIIPIEP